MTKKMKVMALLLGIASIGVETNCQTNKAAIFVSHGGSDSVGASVAFALKEDISKSNRYSVAANKDTAQYEINLASVDVGEAYAGRRGTWSAIAVLVTRRNSKCNDSWVIVTQGVEISGRDRAQLTASEILARADDAISTNLQLNISVVHNLR
jgi:hypothetical protein